MKNIIFIAALLFFISLLASGAQPAKQADNPPMTYDEVYYTEVQEIIKEEIYIPELQEPKNKKEDEPCAKKIEAQQKTIAEQLKEIKSQLKTFNK